MVSQNGGGEVDIQTLIDDFNNFNASELGNAIKNAYKDKNEAAQNIFKRFQEEIQQLKEQHTKEIQALNDTHNITTKNIEVKNTELLKKNDALELTNKELVKELVEKSEIAASKQSDEIILLNERNTTLEESNKLLRSNLENHKKSKDLLVQELENLRLVNKKLQNENNALSRYTHVKSRVDSGLSTQFSSQGGRKSSGSSQLTKNNEVRHKHKWNNYYQNSRSLSKGQIYGKKRTAVSSKIR